MEMDNTRDLIIALRGGLPEKCDFCGADSDDLDPEEGDMWACRECWDRFRREDREAAC